MRFSALPKHLIQPLTAQGSTTITKCSNTPYNIPKTTTTHRRSPLSKGGWTAEEGRAYDTQAAWAKTESRCMRLLVLFNFLFYVYWTRGFPGLVLLITRLTSVVALAHLTLGVSLVQMVDDLDCDKVAKMAMNVKMAMHFKRKHGRWVQSKAVRVLRRKQRKEVERKQWKEVKGREREEKTGEEQVELEEMGKAYHS